MILTSMLFSKGLLFFAFLTDFLLLSTAFIKSLPKTAQYRQPVTLFRAKQETDCKPETLIFPVVKTDLVLSSGFLAFARHAGFLAALEDTKIFEINRIIGTSSGSLAGAMLAAGLSAEEISYQMSRQKPISLVSPVSPVYLHKGAFSLKKMIAHLRTILPKDFSSLTRPLAVGVIDTSLSRHEKDFSLIRDGDLVDAVAASCAIPYIFQPVKAGIPPKEYADGGVRDRTGLADWAEWIKRENDIERRAIVHLVGTSIVAKKSASSPDSDSGEDMRNRVTVPDNTKVYVVRTPKSKASFFSLKDYESQRMEAYGCTARAILDPSFRTDFII